MLTKIVKNSGNGEIAEDSLISYSYSEDVSSLEPSTLDGGTGQVQFSAVAIEQDKIGYTRPNSKLLINNSMSLVDSEHGSVEFQVKSVSVANGVVSVTGDTVQARLNSIKSALPQGSPDGSTTLLTAIEYYCGLVGVSPSYDDGFDDELALISVNFMAWEGNVWEHLKMLCAGVSASEVDNIGIEMYVEGNELRFRKAFTRFSDFSETESTKSIAIDSFEAAKSITVSNYNTWYGEDEIIYEESNYYESGSGSSAFRASITNSLQVEAGQVLKTKFKMNCTLETINQPECVEFIPFLPYTGSVGKYVIVGSDNLPILPAEWLAEGGSITVALTEVPGEIEVTVTAPRVDLLPQAEDPEKMGYAPYRIGVESSGDAEYPAFYITGTGVFFAKEEVKFLTGASDIVTTKDESGSSVDNIFITNRRDLTMRGVAAAQKACGPEVKLSRNVVDANSFGSIVGSSEIVDGQRFRSKTVSYSSGDISIEYQAMTKFSDFEDVWASKTFAQFDNTMLDPDDYPNEAMSFNEFTVIPLMEPV